MLKVVNFPPFSFEICLLIIIDFLSKDLVRRRKVITSNAKTSYGKLHSLLFFINYNYHRLNASLETHLKSP